MKEHKRARNRTLYVCGGAILTLMLASVAWLHSIEAPVLKITQTGSNVFEIGITNGTNTGYYELYHSPVLGDAAYPFYLLQVGAQGQTNFLVTNHINQAGFYWIGVGNDFDGDGITNAADAGPYSTNLGALTILIDSPTNGTTFN